jgi:hypothetical protein
MKEYSRVVVPPAIWQCSITVLSAMRFDRFINSKRCRTARDDLTLLYPIIYSLPRSSRSSRRNQARYPHIKSQAVHFPNTASKVVKTFPLASSPGVNYNRGLPHLLPGGGGGAAKAFFYFGRLVDAGYIFNRHNCTARRVPDGRMGDLVTMAVCGVGWDVWVMLL